MCWAAVTALLALVRPTPAAMANKTTFYYYLFGVTRRKLFPSWDSTMEPQVVLALPCGRLRGSSALGPFWGPVCRLCVEHGLHTSGSNSYTVTCIQVQKLLLCFSAISILSLCLLLLYFSAFHFPLLCFVLSIY